MPKEGNNLTFATVKLLNSMLKSRRVRRDRNKELLAQQEIQNNCKSLKQKMSN
jgi:hypothetical protein